MWHLNPYTSSLILAQLDELTLPRVSQAKNFHLFPKQFELGFYH